MRRRPLGTPPKSARFLPLLILLAALLSSLPAGCNAYRLWQRLPRQRVGDLEAERVRAAFDRARRSLSGEVREAFALRLISDTLAGALAHKVEPPRLQPAIADALGVLSRTQVGRLQQAAARIWLLEQAGEPIENWWPSLRVFLEGMQRADLPHYQAALTRHWARAYESVGIGPGTAYGLADDLVGNPHGPFLQFFSDRMQRVIEEREQAGDTAAVAICRRVLCRLLKQWTLEPGATGLRLLAADLLARSLAEGPSAGAAPSQALARDLRAWRSAYREAVRQRPVAILDPHSKPIFAPDAHERLVTRVAFVTWVGSATLAVGVAALLLTLSWLGPRGAEVHAGRSLLCAVVVAALVVGAGLAWIHLWPDSIRRDLRADFSALRYWWRHPFVAAGLALALVFAAGLLRRPISGGESRFPARLGAVAAGTWLVLAVVLGGSAVAGEFARRDYERTTRAACDDIIAAQIDPDGDRLLATLRQWEP